MKVYRFRPFLMDNKRILIAKIVSAHGLKGQVKIAYFGAGQPEKNTKTLYRTDRTSSGTAGVIFEKTQGKHWIANIEGIENRTQAENLKGAGLYIERADLPESEDQDEFYAADLIGLDVYDLTGNKTGKVTSVDNFGAGDLLEVQLNHGKKGFIPFTKEHFPEIDTEQMKITHADISEFFE